MHFIFFKALEKILDVQDGLGYFFLFWKDELVFAYYSSKQTLVVVFPSYKYASESSFPHFK